MLRAFSFRHCQSMKWQGQYLETVQYQMITASKLHLSMPLCGLFDDQSMQVNCVFAAMSLTFSNSGFCFNGTQQLEKVGFEVSTTWLWYDQIALGSMTIILLGITYLMLRIVTRQK